MTTATLDFTVAHVPEQTFAYVVRRVGPGEASEFVPGAIKRVRAFAESRGGVTGPPALVHLHVGSYDELATLYRSLLAAAHEQGYTPVASPRERYLTVPGDGPPVTEIVWPVG